MLQVVFQNILMNAAQAMEGQGRIDVTITQHDGRCRVAIADHGPGMPEEVREKAFDAFFTTKHRGTGLGLPIARRVVEAHGGTIQIDVPAGAEGRPSRSSCRCPADCVPRQASIRKIPEWWGKSRGDHEAHGVPLSNRG